VVGVGASPSASLRRKKLPMRISGTVGFFLNAPLGFGFIEPDDGGKDMSVHATAVEAVGIRALNEDYRVSIELADDKRGRGEQASRLKAFNNAPRPPSAPIWKGIERSPRTPIPGLYLAFAHAGAGGFTEAIRSGASAADLVMNETRSGDRHE
jgi:cold shock protein